jgi:cytochrome c oxidase assembly factor CtaG
MIAGPGRWQNAPVSSALPAPGAAAVVTQWSLQPVSLVVVAGLAWWYLRAVRRVRARGGEWKRRHGCYFGLGLLALAWTSNGFLQAYLDSLYAVWTSQVLVLWLLVPGILLTGQPVRLALADKPHGLVRRFLNTRLARLLSNPLVSPALVPILSVGLFFGPVPTVAVTVPVLGWLLQGALVLLGALMLLPLLGIDEERNTLAVAVTLALGCVELIVDAVPGIVLRLHRGLVSGYFEHRVMHPWSRPHLADQQTAGAVLWVVAELIDLPFLLLVFRRWLRADAKEAAQVDAMFAAEDAARAALERPEGGPTGDDRAAPLADTPWWLDDPAMRQRLNGPA